VLTLYLYGLVTVFGYIKHKLGSYQLQNSTTGFHTVTLDTYYKIQLLLSHITVHLTFHYEYNILSKLNGVSYYDSLVS